MAKSNAKKVQVEEEIAESPETGDQSVETPEPETQPETAVEPVTLSLLLHTRLEKAVRTMSHSGNPEAAHALNKIELLIGTLKYSLPSGIAAVSDDHLKNDLQSLLALL